MLCVASALAVGRCRYLGMQLDRDLDIGCCVSVSVYPFLGLKEGGCVLCCVVLCCAVLCCAALWLFCIVNFHN